jgi:putative ABC transport system permease protein
MKRYFLICKLAIKGIFRNKVRSFLTILGIIIGIGSVIALIGLGAGAQNEITKSISLLGTGVVTLMPGQELFEGGGGPGGESVISSVITERDYNYLNNDTRFPNIQYISPEIKGRKELKKGTNEINSTLYGVSEGYGEIKDLELTEGSFISLGDIKDKRNLAVIGQDVYKTLFPDKEAAEIIGEDFFIENSKFKIIGVLRPRGETGFGNLDEETYIPYTTAAEKIFNIENFSTIQFKVEDLDLIDATIAQVENKLADFRNIDPDELDFSIYTSEDLLETVYQVTNIFTTLLAGIAAISLLVGGIGISNIMLVSVMERTREIGIRKAVGAKRRDILVQFVIEAVILTLLGGVLGIIFGVLLGWMIGIFTAITSDVTVGSIFLAAGVSIAIGIIFGFAPAYKASKLDPIDALRYE